MQADLSSKVTHSDQLLEYAHTAVVINSSEDYEYAADLLLKVKAFQNSMQPIVDSLRDDRRSILSSIKALTEPANRAEKVLKEALAKWDSKAITDQQQKIKALEHQAQTSIMEEACELLATDETTSQEMFEMAASGAKINLPLKPNLPKVKGISTVVLKRWEIVDENAIHEDFWVRKLNTAKIDNAVKVHGKDAEHIVGGIKYFEVLSKRASAKG